MNALDDEIRHHDDADDDDARATGGGSEPPDPRFRTAAQITAPGCELRSHPRAGWRPRYHRTWSIKDVLRHEIDGRMAEDFLGRDHKRARAANEPPPNPIRLNPPLSDAGRRDEVADRLTGNVGDQIEAWLERDELRVDEHRAWLELDDREGLIPQAEQPHAMITPWLRHRHSLVVTDQAGRVAHCIRVEPGYNAGISWGLLAADGYMLRTMQALGEADDRQLGDGVMLTLITSITDGKPEWAEERRPLRDLSDVFDTMAKRYGALHSGAANPIPRTGPGCRTCRLARATAERPCPVRPITREWDIEEGTRELPPRRPKRRPERLDRRRADERRREMTDDVSKQHRKASRRTEATKPRSRGRGAERGREQRRPEEHQHDERHPPWDERHDDHDDAAESIGNRAGNHERTSSMDWTVPHQPRRNQRPGGRKPPRR